MGRADQFDWLKTRGKKDQPVPLLREAVVDTIDACEPWIVIPQALQRSDKVIEHLIVGYHWNVFHRNHMRQCTLDKTRELIEQIPTG